MDLIHDFMFGWIFREIKKLYFNLHDEREEFSIGCFFLVKSFIFAESDSI